MNQMTLHSRHRISNSSPGGWTQETISVTEASHNTESLPVRGEFFFVSLKPECQNGRRTRDLRNNQYITVLEKFIYPFN